uniref:Peptidase S1 domain-containing protein n=1 Tax=Trichuris muris TaxID=70415 RepID=A0A5S6QA29_TRIMR
MPTAAWYSLFGILLLASTALTTAAGKCGVPAIAPITTSKKRLNRIVSGWEAKPHSLPWMVYMELEVDETIAMCAGSLIDNGMGNGTDMVLTATHCVFYNNVFQPAGRLSVIVGAHNVDRVEDSFVYLKVRNYVTYLYNPENDENDLTLMRLSEPVMYTRYVSPICLATPHTSTTTPTTCFGAGWGKTKKGNPSSALKMTRLNVLPSSECTYNDRDNRALCAENYYVNDLPCMGDSGSPLFCEVEGRYFLFGILSAGPSDCRSVKDFRLHYIKVDAFQDWIRKSIDKLRTAPDEGNNTEYEQQSILLPKRVPIGGLLSSNRPYIPGVKLIAALNGFYEKQTN